MVPDSETKDELVFRGIAVSPGLARGRILVVGRPRPSITRREVPASAVPDEVNRLEMALIQTRQQILDVQRKVSAGMGAAEAGIFDAHLLMLEDSAVLDEVMRVIQDERCNAEHAFHMVAERYAASLAKIEDDYLRERAADLRDVTARVLNNLMGVEAELDLRHLREACIIISHDLTPSNTAQLDRRQVMGFATDVGSATSHTAIMARSLRIPAVVGLQNASAALQSGQQAWLDGYNGLLVLDPSPERLEDYAKLTERQASLEETLRDIQHEPAITIDGRRVGLMANIEKPEDTAEVKSCGADGVGLFRTEYLFLQGENLPTEEEQYQAYRQTAAALKPQPVVIRTLDLGGDKLMAHLPAPHEMNPFLGWRAIRYCLQQPELFRRHLRAILRASAEGNVRLMFPMISGLDELKEATALVERYKEELRNEGVPFDEKIPLGAMVETPSAAMVAGSLARRLSFLSLGTNDLIQYSLAVDRMNEKIAHLYQPTHPAIIKLIRLTVEAAEAVGIEVGVCGEMGGDPMLAPLLLGLGVNVLSCSPSRLPAMKFLIRRLKMTEAAELARFALACESAAEILDRCQELARSIAPGLYGSK